MPPLVSILIPAHNAGKWIAETVSSAMAQTWPDKEVIVVDDGSTDETLQVARRFQSKRVTVVSQENAGAGAARNRALRMAQGEYIQWLDADDLLAPDKIAEQMKVADRCSQRILLSSGAATFCYRPHRARFTPTGLWRDLSPVEWFLTKFNDHVFMPLQAWLVSRELTRRVGPWDERLSLDDDGEYFGRLVAASDEVKFVPAARSYYRQVNSRSVSRTYTQRACESLLLSKTLCIEYLLGLEDSQRTRAASLEFLQWGMICFFPEKVDLLRQLDDFSARLGGKLAPPHLGAKYDVARRLFGWQVAKDLAITLPRYKRMIMIGLDRLNHVLESAAKKYVQPGY